MASLLSDSLFGDASSSVVSRQLHSAALLKDLDKLKLPRLRELVMECGLTVSSRKPGPL